MPRGSEWERGKSLCRLDPLPKTCKKSLGCWRKRQVARRYVKYLEATWFLGFYWWVLFLGDKKDIAEVIFWCCASPTEVQWDAEDFKANPESLGAPQAFAHDELALCGPTLHRQNALPCDSKFIVALTRPCRWTPFFKSWQNIFHMLPQGTTL